MTSSDILKADLLDIVFDNRNKQYGAYTLRKYYPGRLGFSLALALSTMFLLFLFTGSNDELTDSINKPGGHRALDYIIPKVRPPKPVESIIPAGPPVSQRKFVDKIHITNRDVVQDMPRMDDLISNLISDNTIMAPPAGGLPQPVVPEGNGPGVANPVKPAPEEILIQREPEFPGGMEAWVRYLNRNLRVPDELEAGETKTVLIRFMVDLDGSVTGFEVIRSAGTVYDEEVIRVLRKMPKWKPAISNNKAVARSFTQPVTFMGVEY